MKILVTGGFGLVGRAVVGELLAAGHSVRVFDAAHRAARKPPRGARRLEIVYGDLCNIAHVGDLLHGSTRSRYRSLRESKAGSRSPGAAVEASVGHPAPHLRGIAGQATDGPLMFRMPLDTDLEICTTGDVARALAAAVYKPAVVGRILDIAGGRACRTTYREYVGTILGMFGFATPLPAATAPFESVLSNTASHGVA